MPIRLARRRLLAGCGVAATAGLSACSHTPPMSKDRGYIRGSGGRAVDELVDSVVPDGASLTVAAVKDGKLVYRKGFGYSDRARKTPATGDTVYDVCSMTKQFTATAVLKLALAEKLGVHDRLSRYFDAFGGDKRDITLHQLLTHTAGFVDALGGDYEKLTRDGMVRAAAASTLKSRPGGTYRYSNVGYSLLAAIVERVSGATYETYLAEHLFAPAGLIHTGYTRLQWNTDDIAIEYDGRGKPHGRPDQHPWADDGPYWNLKGNGGLLSTATDMAKWHLALEGDAILPSAAKRRLYHPYVLEDNGETHYGYGWVVSTVDGDHIAEHNGGNDFTFGEIRRDLDAGAMAFWITNAVRKGDAFDLEDLDLAAQIVDVLRQLSDGGVTRSFSLRSVLVSGSSERLNSSR
ncbi:MAG TPA: serine hydrolase domain-containing protein [Stackebrandtia sp.]|jgi:CubicO group peptidase (beta-lactamase class C family)|uniref:serine hydrolase domain-containing protein n=1 Tax=Stackebrandtia sp. TaxID=2023065 RepID=UPI002D29E1C6|nr:serine hydrolase domain-containing protein [Stackebrandtia sp.]HZE38609.1 serine hydrolase domain-containing protein [Stackebrandtia sp.]